MDVRFVSPAGVDVFDAAELPALLARTDGLVWVDVPVWDEQAEQTLSTTFGFHPLAIRDSANRNQVPKIHRYDDHLFLVLHAPQPGAGGHVHYVELDQFIGDRYLVTVHGPLNPAVDQTAAMVEVDAVLGRLNAGKLKPDKAFELSYAFLTALTGRLRTYTALVEAMAVSPSYRLDPSVADEAARRFEASYAGVFSNIANGSSMVR